MSPVTWTRVEDGLSVRMLTYSGVETVLEWPSGGIKAFLDTGDVSRLVVDDETPAVQTPADPSRSGDLTYLEALAAHRKALQRLRRAATADPDVSDEVVDLLEDWNLMSVALEFGGVAAVRKAIAESYQRGLLDEGPSHRAG